MTENNMNRRDFTKLTAAAFGGLVAGSMIGCGSKAKEDVKETKGGGDDNKGSGTTDTGGDADVKVAAHACRGLNECKSAKNDCAGKSACSTVEAHECGGHNKCKNQGGCGGTAGANACKEKGGCAVPIKEAKMWKSARAAFEKRMKDAKKEFGDAPAA